MKKIKLERGEWTFDESNMLGPPGGFGEVFLGTGGGEQVAVKRLKISAGAASHREMNMGAALAERTHDHVVPILDYGQDADGDRYYLVMPLCKESLQDSLNTKKTFSFDDAKLAIQDILKGLAEVGDIVHRDLKPGNVLWHIDRWKLADFGIAKFVENATSYETLRSSLTPPYAAPEQWRLESPTKATDIYAVGCIIYALLEGHPPFQGTDEEVRYAHLNNTPAPLLNAEPRLVSLVNTMLRKSPTVRPSISRCQAVIDSLADASKSEAKRAIQFAGQVVSQQEAAKEAERTALEEARRQRKELENEAISVLDAMISSLFDEIEEKTDNAKRAPKGISLGLANLLIEDGHRIQSNNATRLQNTNNSGSWDVVANSFLKLHCTHQGQMRRLSYYQFSTSLVFAKTPDDENYRWREIAFMEMFGDKPMDEQPIALNPLDEHFKTALSNVIGKFQIAYGPYNIDAEDEIDFQERWLNIFAKAAIGKLYPPTGLPLTRSFFDPPAEIG